jgi:stress-induced morphogen
MPHPDELKARIEAHLPGSQAVVSDFNAGTGDHFEAHVGAPQFKGLPLLQQHKLVYAAVQDWLDDGRIHALSIKTVVTGGEEQ